MLNIGHKQNSHIKKVKKNVYTGLGPSFETRAPKNKQGQNIPKNIAGVPKMTAPKNDSFEKNVTNTVILLPKM